MTKFRVGAITGFAVGFYIGAMAGRKRFDQINKLIGKLASSGAFATATGKAKAAANLGVVPHRKTNGGPVTASPLARTPGAPGFDVPTTN
jgi:hypothetical protein